MAKVIGKTDSAEYSRTKVRLTVLAMIQDAVLLALLAFTGISPLFVSLLSGAFSNQWLKLIIFMLCAGTVLAAAGLPLDFYSSYIIEKRYALSNQNISGWLKEKIKSGLLSLLIALPLMLAFYALLRYEGKLWWIYFAAVVILFSAVIAKLAPAFILPLFYKFRTIDSSETTERIAEILQKNGIRETGIYSFNMSKNTKKANAAFAGMGRGRRIIISDTLLENFTPPEIAVIFAHEVGHLKMRHILKNLIINSAILFALFFLCGFLYRITIHAMGFSSVADIGAIPVILFYLILTTAALMPLMNWISRRFEVQADLFAVKTTDDSSSFISAMEKLGKLNLADPNPHPAVEFFLYSHPSISRRIERVRRL